MKKLKLNINIKTYNKNIPSNIEIYNWIKKTINKKNAEITVKIVDTNEIRLINKKYRNLNKPTNILSFKYIKKYSDIYILGDIIICPKIIETEASILNLKLKNYWCKIIIHGILHLLGYNHKNNIDTNIMEKLEEKIIKILIKG